MKKGLLVFILRDSDGRDCTNGGISSKFTKAILIGDNVPEIFESSEDAPALQLVRRDLPNGEYLHAEPVNQPTDCAGPMAGGNFIYSCDSRFRAINPYPLPIHDRFETAEEDRFYSI